MKIGGLKYDRLSPIETDLLMEMNKEHIRERKQELVELEHIKNSVRQQIIDKQTDRDTQYIDFDELELIYIGNKNKTTYLSTQFVNYLYWLVYRHHAPTKPYNFLVITIMVLMILEVVGYRLNQSYHATLFYLDLGFELESFKRVDIKWFLILELFLILPLASPFSLFMGMLCV